MKHVCLILATFAACIALMHGATNDYIWSQKPASGPLVSRNLTPTVGRIIGFPTSINSPETIIIGSGLSLSGTTLTASGGAFSTLTDVTLTSLASGDFLKWSGTAWINRTAADARSDLGLGTLATQSATITDYLTSATAATTYQPLDADLTTLASATAAGLALMDDASASAQRTTLGLGTIATQAASSVAITGGTLSGITSFAGSTSGSVTVGNSGTFYLPSSAIGGNRQLALVSVANGGSGYELHYGDKDGGDRTVMTLDYAQTPTNKTISGATNTITDLNASNLASGTVATARLGSGTANNTTYLRGDSTWQTITAGATLGANTFTGVQTLAAGSVSAPSLTMTGMTSDTGMYSTGTADEIAFAVSGAIKVKITADKTTLTSTDTLGGILTLAGYYGTVPMTIDGSAALAFNTLRTASYGTRVEQYANAANYINQTSDADRQWINSSSSRLCVGIPSATPAAHTLSGPEGVGENVTGGTLYIGTRGTGTGTSGAIIFQTHASGASSATPGTLSARLTINTLGEIIPVLPTSAAGLTTGALWNDGGTVKVAP